MKAILPDRAVIALSGPDVRNFLQGLITNDMDACGRDRALYAGLLTPQGKLLFDFLLIEDGNGRILLDCARERADDLMKRLSFYKLRAKVTIEAAAGFSVAAFWGEARPTIANAVTFADPRLPELGFRAIAPEADLARAIDGRVGDYEAHRIALGVPGSADTGSDQVFALDAGFEELNGVSFRKGCYVGQEVTARMKHRSTARRRFLIVEGDSAMAAGTPLEADGKEIGTVSSAHAQLALALVRLDRVADAEHAGVPITAAGKPVRLRKPAWLKL